MSAQTEQSSLNRLERALVDFEKKLGELDRKEADLLGKIGSAQQSALRSSSASTIAMYARQIDGYQRDLIRLKGDRARLYSAKANKQRELGQQRERYQRAVAKEASVERKANLKLRDKEAAERRRLTEQLSALQSARALTVKFTPEQKSHDFFISHASEDKEDFVRGLAGRLEERGAVVWYDEFSLRVGDSLRRSIDRGIASSKFGVVVLSPSFFQKEWPQKELDALVALEDSDEPRVLPIWHKISKDEVAAASPLLSGKLALKTAVMSLDEIVELLMDRLRPSESENSTASL